MLMYIYGYMYGYIYLVDCRQRCKLDKYGRRMGFLLGAAIIILFGILTGFATNYYMLVSFRVIVGFGLGGATIPFDLLAEFLDCWVCLCSFRCLDLSFDGRMAFSCDYYFNSCCYIDDMGYFRASREPKMVVTCESTRRG